MLITIWDQIWSDSQQYRVCCSDYEDWIYTTQEIIKKIITSSREFKKDSRIIIEFF